MDISPTPLFTPLNSVIHSSLNFLSPISTISLSAHVIQPGLCFNQFFFYSSLLSFLFHFSFGFHFISILSSLSVFFFLSSFSQRRCFFFLSQSLAFIHPFLLSFLWNTSLISIFHPFNIYPFFSLSLSTNIFQFVLSFYSCSFKFMYILSLFFYLSPHFLSSPLFFLFTSVLYLFLSLFLASFLHAIFILSSLHNRFSPPLIGFFLPSTPQQQRGR